MVSLVVKGLMVEGVYHPHTVDIYRTATTGAHSVLYLDQAMCLPPYECLRMTPALCGSLRPNMEIYHSTDVFMCTA